MRDRGPTPSSTVNFTSAPVEGHNKTNIWWTVQRRGNGKRGKNVEGVFIYACTGCLPMFQENFLRSGARETLHVIRSLVGPFCEYFLPRVASWNYVGQVCGNCLFFNSRLRNTKLGKVTSSPGSLSNESFSATNNLSVRWNLHKSRGLFAETNKMIIQRK